TLAVMKLQEEGKLTLNQTLGEYFPNLRKTNKAGIRISEMLLHHSGLPPGVPVRMDIFNDDGVLNKWFRLRKIGEHQTQVAEELFLRNDWKDTIWKRVHTSNLRSKSYAYSDLGFLYLGKIVEKVSGKLLEEYVDENFYRPLGLSHTTFHPRRKIDVQQIVPAEYDYDFRKRLIQGHVQDPTAAMLGGSAGNAGL